MVRFTSACLALALCTRSFATASPCDLEDKECEANALNLLQSKFETVAVQNGQKNDAKHSTDAFAGADAFAGMDSRGLLCKNDDGEFVETEEECAATACGWYRVPCDEGEGDCGKCFEAIDRMFIAGTMSTMMDYGDAASGGTEVYRPEYMTTLAHAHGEWTPCFGRENCWYGEPNVPGHDHGQSWIKGHMSGAVNKLVLLVPFQCDGAPVVRIKAKCDNADIARLLVRYNGVVQEVTECESPNGEPKDTLIPINPDATEQQLDVAMEAVGPPGLPPHRVRVRHVQIMIPKFSTKYDSCMQNTQCLKKLIDADGGACELRTDNSLKWQCLNAETQADVNAVDCCGPWKACLDDDTEASLKKKYNAMYGSPSLVQAREAKRHGDDDSCTCDDSQFCENPDIFDVTKTECEECWEWIQDSTEAEIEEFIRKQPKVCCSWKNTKGWGCTPAGASMLSQRAQVDHRTEGEHSLRSLDSAVLGKCTQD